ncbi:MAG TPA: carboxypeptidase-like regulatory domain-containing protein [Gemmatimonadaceae bacterium]|nr:carboxypeptidase-like regulatory domain-containing protein [Gemmatimonadaceae bacterium]
MLKKTVWVILLSYFAITVGAYAQSPTQLRVRILATSGAPIEGALVALVDQKNSVIAEGLTSVSGNRALTAPSGSYRVRVRRIGFAPFYSDILTIPYEGTLTLRVRSDQVSLKTVVVRASSACRQPAEDRSSVALVWEEITKALRSSQLTLGDFVGLGQARTYNKQTGLKGEVFVNQSRTVAIKDHRPFGIDDPATLAKKGYVRGNEYRGWEFFGPDESVLLSQDFASTHCFTVVRDSTRQGQIGVGFRPTPKRKLSDIAGVLWVDEASSQLREMNFRYVNVRLPEGMSGGGFTKFLRTPSGGWLVDEWKLTMPLIEMRRAASNPYRREFVQVGTAETGGSIIPPEAVSAEAVSANTVSTVVRGIVFDSLNQRPLRKAAVTLGNVTVRSGKDGRFTFRDVEPGQHTISFTHAALQSLGLTEIESQFQLTGSSAQLFLSVPSLGAVWPRICRDTASTVVGNDARGVLHGTVNSLDGKPVVGARVRVTYRERPPVGLMLARAPTALSFEVITDNFGQFSACGFTSEMIGAAEVMSKRKSVARTTLDFTKASVVQTHLVVPRPPALIPDTAGKKMHSDVLDSVGFYRRQSREKAGTFFKADEIDQHDETTSLVEIFRDIPGIAVISPSGKSGYEDYPQESTTACPLTLVIDGEPTAYYTGETEDSTAVTADDKFGMLLPPDLIEGIEVYPAASTIPAELEHYSKGCGLIVVWLMPMSHR